MTKILLVVFGALIAFMPVAALAENGVVTKASPRSAEETTNRLEETIKSRGMKVFARLDHAAAAEEFGLSMPYSTVVVYGNPELGTPNFIDNPPLAIDLPLKALVWEDADGEVWLSYNSSSYVYDTLYERHNQPYPSEQVGNFENFHGGLMNEVVQE